MTRYYCDITDIVPSLKCCTEVCLLVLTLKKVNALNFEFVLSGNNILLSND